MNISDLKEKYLDYLNTIENIGFAKGESMILPKNPETDEEIYEAVSKIIDFSKEMNLIIEQSPTSIYVADTDGKTLRTNHAFENTTGISGEPLLGRTTNSIEEDEIFQPSVCSIVLKEKKRVIVPQVINNREFIVAGTPIFDENGKLYRVITNALLNEDTDKIGAYFREMHMNNVNSKTLPSVVAVSEGMQNVVKLADLIKNTKSTIMIEGETGVGKSILARYIHYSSERGDHKMTEINCGAIPPALLESELFGYAGGAFTGADKKGKPGLIEICDGGTILLDEISEMPMALQVKLLHFLQNKTITRVGGTEEIPVDVRVIAATNKTLENLVEKGEFREDLFYRLNVVPIVIPPLRERKDDIMPAVKHFLDKYSALYNKTLKLDDKDIDFFMNSYWKGNLRELENWVERMVVTDGVHELTEGLKNPAQKDTNTKASISIDKGESLEDVERQMVIEAYNKYKSSYKVAKELGISQSSAYRKIKKYVNIT